MQRLLLDRPARLVDLHLARDLALDAFGGEGERVHVLQFRPRSELARSLRAHRDVHVEAHRALLELGVRQSELDDGLPKQLQEPLRGLGVVQVGGGDDLDERCAAAVEVDERRRCALNSP